MCSKSISTQAVFTETLIFYKIVPLGFNIFIPLRFPLVETPLNLFFWYGGKLCCPISFNHSSSNLIIQMNFQFWKQEKVRGNQPGYEMEFCIEKCAMIIMKSEKREIMEELEIENLENIRTLGEKECKIRNLNRNTGSWHHQTSKDEEKHKKRRIRKLLKTKCYGRNFLKGINTRAFLLSVRYLGPF